MPITRETTCAVFGPRHLTPSEEATAFDYLDKELLPLIENKDVRRVLTTALPGFSLAVARWVIGYGHPLTLGLLLPCRDLRPFWPGGDTSPIEAILSQAHTHKCFYEGYDIRGITRCSDYMRERAAHHIYYLSAVRSGPSFTRGAKATGASYNSVPPRCPMITCLGAAMEPKK